jgi:hypothetical protein
MSFSDMMSSGRGPGVIGTLMALFVLLGFGVLFLFAFDEGSQGGDRSIESVIAQQAKDIDGYHASIDHGRKSLEQAPARKAATKEMDQVKRGNKTLRDSIARLMNEVEEGRTEIVQKNEEFEVYKDQYRAFARDKAKDETIGRLETLTGVAYADVVIREVTPVGIQIRHADGHKRIPFEELPEAMKDQFQFDPKQKDKALAEEAATRNVLEAAVAASDAMTDQAKANKQAADAEVARKNTLQTITSKETRIASLNREIEHLDKAIPMESLKKVGRAGIMREELALKRREVSELRAQIANLQSRL